MSVELSEARSVPVEPFRKRAVALVGTGQATWYGLAMRAGWTRIQYRSDRPNPKIAGDTSRFKRAVGLEPHIKNHKGVHYSTRAKTVSRKTARMLCEVLEMDPVDVDGL